MEDDRTPVNSDLIGEVLKWQDGLGRTVGDNPRLRDRLDSLGNLDGDTPNAEDDPTNDAKNGLAIGQLVADRLLVETGMLECSIAASDTAKEAAEIFILQCDAFTGTENNPYNKRLFMADQEFRGKETTVLMLGSEHITANGRAVQLALTKPTQQPKKRLSIGRTNSDATPEPLTLTAITRDSIAFPLAYFRRSNKQYCDHLQFFGEDTMDELESTNFYGWGSDDHGSRFDAVQAIGALMNDVAAIQQESAEIDLSRRASAVTDHLKLDERMDAQLGACDPAVEGIINQVMRCTSLDQPRTVSRVFRDVQMGKVMTDLRVEGTVEPVGSNPHRRRFVIKSHPSSQPDREWPEQIFMIDQCTGIVRCTPEGEDKPPTETDIQLMNSLTEGLKPIQQTKVDQKIETHDRLRLRIFLAGCAISSTGFYGSAVMYQGAEPLEAVFQSGLLFSIMALGSWAVKDSVSAGKKFRNSNTKSIEQTSQP